MNASDILRYGHLTLLGTFEQAPEGIVERPGACGVWSIKDIMAHLASYELILVDILGLYIEGGPTPVLDRYRSGPEFNDLEVEARRTASVGDVLTELNDAHERTLELVSRIEPELLRQPGSIPWYGVEYALEDLIVYLYYGHKREHSAQIEAFRDRLAREDVT